MAKVTLPPGYCSKCYKATLDRVDLITDAEEKLSSLKKKMMTAFMIGDRDGALAEISYQLGITPGELSVSGPWEAPAMDRKMAAAIAEEIFFKFPEVLERLFEESGLFEKMRRQDEYRRREMERSQRQMAMWEKPVGLAKLPRDFGEPTLDDMRHAAAKRDYYIPPYTVKKNEKG